jgi:polysaccharide deacetylase 2 family uncharacterized protein YibQ
VATDELNAPLGLTKAQARNRLPPYAAPVAAGLLGAVIATFAVWAIFNADPLGGEPMGVVKVDVPADGGGARERKPKGVGPGVARQSGPPDREAVAKPPQGERSPEKSETGLPDQASGTGEQIVTIIDGKSGARQEVKIPSTAESSVLKADSQLVEMTRNGPIPRIGADGLRAAQAYAKPVSKRTNSPQIAIVITGLGISANGTTDAINKLPGPITFAFGPYGADLERVVGRARGLGHELLLQVPMEPFDYPENDPGPQTLVTSLTPEQNIERLQWAMSRFQGYVGILNQMGARFTASEASFSPIIREVGKRGLIYVDDGSSPRSLASQIAGGNSLAFAKASLVLDTVPSAAEIDRALVRLEGVARENGIAVAVAAALPVTIERIAIWAKTAENRGFTLAPISAAANRAKSS